MKHQDSHPNHFQGLNLPEIELHAVTWAERYQEIEDISLYRAHTDESFKYSLIITVLDPKYPFLNWATSDCLHIRDDLPSFYKEQPPQDVLDYWMWYHIEHGDEIPSEFVIGDTKLSLYARKGVEPKPESKFECEDFVRSLRVYYENIYEIKIQEPKKQPRTFNHGNLGFCQESTNEWKNFRNLIEGPDHFYKVGSAKQRKPYDRKMKNLYSINKKLIAFLEKEYQLQIPKEFKIYERAPEEGAGVYRFKFLVGSDAQKSKYHGYPKEKWFTEFNLLKRQYKEALQTGSEHEVKSLLSNIKSKTAEAFAAGLITKKEVEDMLQEKKIFEPLEIDESKRFEHDPDIDDIR